MGSNPQKSRPLRSRPQKVAKSVLILVFVSFENNILKTFGNGCNSFRDIVQIENG